MIVNAALEEQTRLRVKTKENGLEKPTEDDKLQINDDARKDRFPSDAGSKTRKDKVLLRISDVPNHLKFNPHILSGYRPLQSPLGCIGSVFQWHNETINIVTHGKLLDIKKLYFSSYDCFSYSNILHPFYCS